MCHWCPFPIKSVSAMSKNDLASGESNLFELFRALSSSRRSLRERGFFFFVTRRGVEPLLALGFKLHKGSVPVCQTVLFGIQGNQKSVPLISNLLGYCYSGRGHCIPVRYTWINFNLSESESYCVSVFLCLLKYYVFRMSIGEILTIKFIVYGKTSK